MLVPWHVMHIGMSCMLVCHACWYVCMLVCHVCWYVMYVGVSCMLVCHVCWYVMYVGVSCMLVCHVCWCVMHTLAVDTLVAKQETPKERRRNAEDAWPIYTPSP